MTGAMLIAASTDLLILFLGLELMVLPGYLLAGFHKTDGYSTEGAIKYFLLGSFSSAIFLFGLAFVWGLTGIDARRRRRDRARRASSRGAAPLSPGLAMGLAFMTTGVAFKIAAVPFHYWTPDAYQGSPTPITGYLSVAPEGRRVRPDPAPVRRGPRAAGGVVAAGDGRPRRGDDDPGQPRRADPGQRQTDAGVQLDRPHRLHAGGPGRVGGRPGGSASAGSRRCSSTARPTRS